MSFSIVGPFSFGSKVTSTQFNQLDSDHANALDKSVAGDSIAGTITFTGAGKINANLIGTINFTAAQAGTSNANGGFTSLVTYGIIGIDAASITTTSPGGIAPAVGGSISDGGQVGGIVATVAKGINDGGTAHGIGATVAGGIYDGGVAGGIAVTTAGGLKSNTGGGNGIKLVGSTEFIDYQVSRLVTRTIWLGGVAPATGWTTAGAVLIPTLLAPGSNAHAQVVALNNLMDGNYNGSTLISATLIYAIAVGRVSLPSFFPYFDIYRLNINSGGNPNTVQSLFSGGVQHVPTPGSVGAYESSGHIQQLASTPDQDNFIDLNNYLYVVSITDEQGGGAIANNQYIGLKLEFGNITNSGLY